jgi:hypothetical protein
MRALNRELTKDVYIEKHHVYPKSVYGDNNFIVPLTAREHFIAHQLLVKIFPTSRKLIYAARMMTINDNRSQKRNNNRMYCWLKEAYSKAGQSAESNKKRSEKLKGRKQSVETRKKKSIALQGHKGWNKGGTRPDYIKKILSEANKGKPKTEEHRKKLSAAKLGKKLGPHSKETKRKISEARKGVSNKQSKVTCPHCNKIGGKGNMKRFHFDNCKH